MTYTALLDANVLYPAVTRDILVDDLCPRRPGNALLISITPHVLATKRIVWWMLARFDRECG